MAHIALFFTYFAVCIVIIAIFGIMMKNIIWMGVILFITMLILSIIHIRYLQKNSRYTFTSRRCIYFVKKSLFKRHYNEIHITELRQAIPKKSGILGKIFGYGTLIIKDKDEKTIVYAGITEQQQMSRYLGRIMDYIKTSGHIDDFTIYMHADERKEYKKSL